MSENKHPIQGVMETSMQNLRDMVDANTIIGEPIRTADGTTLIPVSKISFGFASGGSDFSTKKENAEQPYCFGGGSGAGVNITPISFLVVSAEGNVSMLPVTQTTVASSAVDKFVDSLPDVIEKLKAMFKKEDSEA
ncbi:MAG: GerW family sporulation protein [Clostridia bacterium]|nr:GerW family sporulation protein [Clostridia bacterium]